MSTPLNPLSRVNLPAFRRIKIAAFNGSEVSPREPKVRTLGDCMDAGQAVRISCDCSRRIVEIFPQKFLRLKLPQGEATPVRELTKWLRCETCGIKGLATTAPTGRWSGGLVPRVNALDKQAGTYPKFDP